MEILDKFGLDIQQKKGKCPGCYISSRDFELPELKLLVDAVQSSKFITEKNPKNYKSSFLLSRQCLREGAKVLILLGFLDGNVEFTPLEDQIGNQDMEKGKIRLQNLELMNASIKLRSKCMLLIFHAQSSGTFSFEKLFVSPL